MPGQTVERVLLLTAVLTLVWVGQALAENQPLPEGVEDNGINVLWDSSHQFLFFWHWEIQDAIRKTGFRVTGSQATLSTVLDPTKLSRMRDQRDHRLGTYRPFIWAPNPKFNVVLIYQFGKFQPFLPEERAALADFVRGGGGLVTIGKSDDSGGLPLNDLAGDFGAQFSDTPGPAPVEVADDPLVTGLPVPAQAAGRVHTVRVSTDWRPLVKAGDGTAVVAIREFGKGRVCAIGDDAALQWGKKEGEPADIALLARLIKWTAGGSPPVGGSRDVAYEVPGMGGAIYPELDVQVAGLTVFYAANQQPGVIRIARERLPEVKTLLDKMLPSPPPPGERMYVILAAGTGGGWAVNDYTPKSAAVGAIETDEDGILSVLAHELAHTMPGPAASDGSVGGILPPLFSEAHAGWFQRKVGTALGFTKPTIQEEAIAIWDPSCTEVDIANAREDQMWPAWMKLMWIWQIFDYRYGPDWYPKWMQTVHETYKNDREHHLTWDEVIATMSRAVGEDLFPFFQKVGTTVHPVDLGLPPMKKGS